MRTIVWYRGKDLRLADHQPLVEAADLGEVVPLFVMSPRYFARATELPHRMQFLLESLQSLKRNLQHLGSDLVVMEGPGETTVPELAERWRADRVVAHRTVEPDARKRDELASQRLRVPLELFEGETLAAPGSIRSGAGKPFSVYSHFARVVRRDAVIAQPLRAPDTLPPVPEEILADSIELPSPETLGLTRNPRLIEAGERAARKRLWEFLRYGANHYDERRDRMDLDGTSRLSQDLKFGTLSVRTAWTESLRIVDESDARDRFLNELLWREFSYHMFWDRPTLLELPFRKEFVDFPWREDDTGWDAWVRGRTGYPIVDAAARQLLAEGFVHNRARMVAASFLTKHLMIDYRRGEAHYLKYLTDGDWAANNCGWQWSAGCGCDAQPYFRIFNPITQGKKFDPDGNYVRRWVPELKALPVRWIHRPWEAPSSVLQEAGVSLGSTYPLPIVDHREARERFLFTASNHLSRNESHVQDRPQAAKVAP